MAKMQKGNHRSKLILEAIDRSVIERDICMLGIDVKDTCTYEGILQWSFHCHITRYHY